MKTYKYKIGDQSNTIRIGNLLDDMWQVHAYFHKWQDQRYKDGLPYANYHAMSAHVKDLKRTTHPHWKSLPSQAIQAELERIDNAYQRLFNKLGGKPHIKPRHKFKSITLKQTGYKLTNNRITLTFRSGIKVSGDLIKCLIRFISTGNGTAVSDISQSNVTLVETIGFVSRQPTQILGLCPLQVKA